VSYPEPPRTALGCRNPAQTGLLGRINLDLCGRGACDVCPGPRSKGHGSRVCAAYELPDHQVKEATLAAGALRALASMTRGRLMENLFAAECPPTPAMGGTRSIAIGLIVLSVGLTTPSFATAQSLSINEWLQAERHNPNLQRSLHAYDEARAGLVMQSSPVSGVGGVLPRHSYSSDSRSATEIAVSQSPTFDERRIRAYADGADARLSGVYISGHLGNAFVMASDYEADVATLTPSFDLLGIYGSGAVGVDFGSGLSLETALSYQSADVDKLTLTGTGAFSGISLNAEDVKGSVSALSLMANGIYAFADRRGLSPYVMGGVGVSRISLNGLDEAGGNDPTDDAALTFAWQAGAGVTVPLTSNTSFDLGYRYFDALVADMDDEGVPFTAGFSSHTILIGLKHRL